MPLITKLPLDLYGTSNTNRVVGEEHTVDSLATNIFALDKGPFYSHPSKLTVYSVTLQRNLVPGTDFICLQHYQELTEKTGHEVMCAIMITNTEAYGVIRVTAQMVGGPYQNIVDALIEVIDQLELDNRPVNWGDIIGLPDAFVPADHLHHLDDIYGWEYLADATNNVADAILTGSQATLMEVLQAFTDMQQEMMAAVEDVRSQLVGHEETIGNPHQITKSFLGIDQVPNYPMSTKLISEARTSNEYFMSPLQVSYLLDVHPVTTGLASHLAASNPHNITKTTIGLSNIFNYGVATLTDFNASAADKYVVVNLLKTVDDNNRNFTTSSISTAIGNHLAASNPHNISKTTVGLSNVLNYAVGSITDFNNAASDKYVTTVLLKTVDDNNRNFTTSSISTSMSSHLAASNPHGITKTTIGLSNVLNYAVASLTDFNNSASDKYVTANLLKTVDDNNRTFTNSAVSTSMSSHLAASNPHNISKTTVGLGNVLNYGVATLTDFNNGLSTKYMTADIAKSVDNATRGALNLNIATTMSDHLASYNPHDISKITVGLGNVDNNATANDTQTIAGTSNSLFTTPAGVLASIQQNSPIKSFQGRTAQAAVLQASDRTSLGMAETQDVKFNTVIVGTPTATGVGTRRTRLVASVSNPSNYGHNGHLEDTVDALVNRYYFPWLQGNASRGRMLATEWLGKPYVMADEFDLAPNAEFLNFNVFKKGYQVFKVNDATNNLLTIRPYGNEQLLPGNMDGSPDSGRDRANTPLEDGTNQWFYSCVVCLNPGNRNIVWNDFIWGDAGAPALTPNAWNFIIVTMALTRRPSDGTHFFSGWRSYFLGSGF